jgi:nicotinamide-nucleotide amidase
MFRKSPAQFVHDTLTRTGASLAVAESLTAGHLQALIAERSGASKFFKGGVTAYSIPMKAKLLGVDAEAAERCDAVSSQVAWEMATGICRLYEADFGVATTGYAGPYEERAITEPYAHVAIASLNGDVPLFEGVFRGPRLSRQRMQIETAEFALKALAQILEGV